MSEDFLIYLWTFQLIRPTLQTTQGEKVNIIHPGQRNQNSGPDFFNAKIKIGETIWAGNVEIHINASDWFKHEHQDDDSYDNIILHIVYNDNKAIYRSNGEPMPTVELNGAFDQNIYSKYQTFIDSNKWIPCQERISEVNHFDMYMWLDSLMAERLTEKAEIIQKELDYTKQDFQEVFYLKLATNFGFKVNAIPFGLLARSLPLKILAKHHSNFSQIESLLFGQAGLLKKNFKDPYAQSLHKEYSFLSSKYQLTPIDQKLWKFMRLRPVNFPTIRISQFANIIYKSSALLTQILNTEKLSSIIQLLDAEASAYWDDHYQFDKPSKAKKKSLGLSSIHLLLINTIIPFLFVYGDLKNDTILTDKALLWMEQIKPESNELIRKYIRFGIKPQNAVQSQALIQLKNKYCSFKRCLDCRIGHQLLKQ